MLAAHEKSLEPLDDKGNGDVTHESPANAAVEGLKSGDVSDWSQTVAKKRNDSEKCATIMQQSPKLTLSVDTDKKRANSTVLPPAISIPPENARRASYAGMTVSERQEPAENAGTLFRVRCGQRRFDAEIDLFLSSSAV